MAIWNARLYNELKTTIYINKGAHLAMPETEPSSQSSILDSLKLVIHNGIDYLMGSLTLLQSKMTGLALSAILFLVALFICLLFFIVFVIYFQWDCTLVIHLRSFYNMAESTIGFFFTINTILILLFEMLLIKRLEHFHPLKLAGLGALFIGGGMGLIMFGSSFLYVTFVVGMWTLGEIVSATVMEAYVARRAGSHLRSQYLSLFNSMVSLALVIAPLVGTMIYQKSPNLLWYGCMVIGLLLCIAYFFMAHKDRKILKAQ